MLIVLVVIAVEVPLAPSNVIVYTPGEAYETDGADKVEVAGVLPGKLQV